MAALLVEGVAADGGVSREAKGESPVAAAAAAGHAAAVAALLAAGANPGMTDAAHRNALHRAAQARARPCMPVEPFTRRHLFMPVEPFTRLHLSGFGAIAPPTATRALAARAAPQARAAAHRGAILRACGCSCAPP